MKRLLILLTIASSYLGLQANPIVGPVAEDTLYTEMKNDIVILSTTKETNSLRSIPAAVSILSPKRLEALQIKNLKGLSSYIPNYSAADYGSKMTAPIYIRGIGARSGTQTVSMYVDNIPYFNTTSFDIELMDIQRVEVLRGTQSTLYGRNAMGGLLNVYTYSPLDYQGTKIQLGGGSYGEIIANASTHHLVSKNLGLSASAYYKRHDGYFRNSFDKTKADALDNLGGRVKLAWRLAPRFTASFSTSFDYVDQGAFPYFSKKTNEIGFSSDAYYQRKLLTNGLALRYEGNGFEINSTTGYQYLNDEMNMDQDYTVNDVFQINQRQNENSLSQEFTIKSTSNSNYQWSAGVFGFYDYLKTTAPVYMMNKGIQTLIQPGVDRGMIAMDAMMRGMMTKAMQEAGMPPHLIGNMVERAMQTVPSEANITSDEIALGGLYRNKVYGGAVFHQSTYNNLLVDGLSITLGARLDYEKTSLDYESVGDVDFTLEGRSSVPQNLRSLTSITGKVTDDYFEFLPKGILKYNFTPSSYIYGSVARGYKTGGHNIQIFADVLQEALMNDMTLETVRGIFTLIPESTMTPEEKEAALQAMASAQKTPTSERISFKPEYSWSYEVGGKLDIIENRLSANFAAYYMDVKDVQVTQFVTSSTGKPSGRLVSNAGKARSQGIELGLNGRPCTGVFLYANYGFAHAKFRDYIASRDNDGNPVADYSGNYIPFAPRSTFSAGGSISYDTKRCSFLDRMTLDVNFMGTGKIYWDEANTKSQGFHGEVNAKLGFHKGKLSIEAWGENLLNKTYDTFLFTSQDVTVGEYIDYGQKNKPIRFGASIKIAL